MYDNFFFFFNGASHGQIHFLCNVGAAACVEAAECPCSAGRGGLGPHSARPHRSAVQERVVAVSQPCLRAPGAWFSWHLTLGIAGEGVTLSWIPLISSKHKLHFSESSFPGGFCCALTGAWPKSLAFGGIFFCIHCGSQNSSFSLDHSFFKGCKLNPPSFDWAGAGGEAINYIREVPASVGAGLARVREPPWSLWSALDVLSHLTHQPPAATPFGLSLSLMCFILHGHVFCLPSPSVDLPQDFVFGPFLLVI